MHTESQNNADAVKDNWEGKGENNERVNWNNVNDYYVKIFNVKREKRM